MSSDLGQKDDRIAELERLLNSLQQNNQQDEQEPNTAMDIDNEDADPKDEDDLLSYDSEEPKDNNLEFQSNNNLEFQSSKTSDSKLSDRSDDLEEEDDPSLDSINSNEHNVPPTPLQTAPNIPQQSDCSLKRRTTDKEDIPVDTNQLTRAKTSLQIAAQEKTSPSEGVNDL